MTIQEIRDLFNAQYHLQAQLRKIEPVIIPDKLTASFISQAQQDIQRRLLVVETYTTLSLNTTSDYVYSLPTNFGKHKHAFIGDTLLTERPERYIREQIAIGNTGDWYGIYQSGNTQRLITPHTTGTLTLFYYPDFHYYQPSLSSSQDWGIFNGVAFTGDLMLPDRYDMAVLYFMLSQVLPDYWALYEKEIKSLKGSRISSVDDSLGYELGGVNEATIISATTASSSATVIAATDSPDKKLRVRVSDTGADATVEYSDGWTTDPTTVNNVTSIVITSADNEFTNFIHVDINNEDFSYSMSAGTITITPKPTTGWGDVEIIVEVWN